VIRRIHCGDRTSQAVVHGDLVYASGQVDRSATAETSVAAQTRAILSQIDLLLAEAGTSKASILSATVWLVDIGTWDEMNRIWVEWIEKGAAPARATVEARLAGKEYRVEIAVIAAIE
jgi:enamine deaminase RidA (YjgF/YER057c/UK114 family)